MRKIINVQIEQAGAQMGAACWELYCSEHIITPEGALSSTGDARDHGFDTFLSATQSGRFLPRALFADLEPTLVDEIRSGPHR